MNIGFIGCGNMATAIIDGLVSTKTVNPSDIMVYDILTEATEKASKEFSVTVVMSTTDLIKNSDIIFLAVKPNMIEKVFDESRKALKERNPLIVSIAAGKEISFLENSLNISQGRIIRVMPNINAKVGEGMYGICSNKNTTAEDERNVEGLLSSSGKVLTIEEKHFPVFSVIAGCGPAFVYMFIDALARAGVKNGMGKNEALSIVAQTVLGSASMILNGDEHPWSLIDKVCSPGGTTIEGITSLQKDGFENAVHNAVDKAVEKDKRL